MIPKPLKEIEWSDIESLKDSGREEDDTIEFKASFSGGSDYLEFNDAKRAKAIEGIAREAVAFLNGRGGDIVIGVREAANDHPKIEEITPVQNIDQTVDRLAQSLAALIEPAQSVLGLRAIRRAEGDSEGIIIVRCPSSLRAPHRYSPTKDCYVRRGRSSVPMPMDEVQDVTLNRAMRRAERNALLDQQFDGFAGGNVGIRNLPNGRFHIRTVYVPNSSSDIEFDDEILRSFSGNDPVVSDGSHTFSNDVAFRNLDHPWRQQLRGKRREGFYERAGGFVYCAKSIKRNLTMMTEISNRYEYNKNEEKFIGVYGEWLISYFANTLTSIKDVLRIHPQHASGTLRTAIFVSEGFHLIQGDRMWVETYPLISGITVIPDFQIEGLSSFSEAFVQLQIDVYSLAGVEFGTPYKLPNLT